MKIGIKGMGEKRKIQLPIGIPQPNFRLPCGFSD